MALESSPDPTGTKVKHAMWQSGCRSSSNTSLSPSILLSDSAAESSTSFDFNHMRLGLGNPRRHAVLDVSIPRVHSTGRAVDGGKALQPDLITHHRELQRPIVTPLPLQDLPERDNNIHEENVPNGLSLKKRHSDPAHLCRLNIPGNSVVVCETDPVCHLESYAAPVVTADKLRPYPPGLITIVKEGPAHETPSSLLLTSIEQELEQEFETLESPQSSRASHSMDAEVYVNGGIENGVENKGCHCRIVLEERLNAAVNKCLALQHQVELSDSKCTRWEKDAGEATESSAMLQTRVAELEIELAARQASLHSLKAIFAEQYMKNDDINERSRHIERDYKAQLTQLDSLKKSEQWYRENLHLTQVERSTLQKKLMSAEEEQVRLSHDVQKLMSDLKKVKDQLAEAEERSLKEKQNFTMRLDKALAFPAHPIEDISKSNEVVDGHTVSELKQRIRDLEISCEASNKNTERTGNEMDRLLTRNLQLQRELSETKITLQEDQDRYMSAVKDRERAEAELKERELALRQLSQEHAELGVRLDCQLRERREQQEALQTLTRNFTNVSSRFNKMRSERQGLSAQAQSLKEELRKSQAARDSLQDRLEEAERRQQSAVVAERLQATEREAARGVREAQLEHDVLALREAAEIGRGQQQRADQLQVERDQLSSTNDQLRAQVDRLSQLLQQNTGSRLRDQQGEDSQLAQLQAEMSKLQVEKGQLEFDKGQLEFDKGQLEGQVQRSAERLEELSLTILALEAEMSELKQQSNDQAAAEARSEVYEKQLSQLRTENEQLQREKHDLTARVAELNQWLDTMTQGLGLAEQGHTVERLAKLSTSPVRVDDCLDDSGVSEAVSEALPEAETTELRDLRDANNELALYAAALERRLSKLEFDNQPPRPAVQAVGQPDLLPTTDGAQGEVPRGATSDVAEARGLLALLQVCLRRVQEAGGVHGPLRQDDDDALQSEDVRRLAACIGRGVDKLATGLEGLSLPLAVMGTEELPAAVNEDEDHRNLRELRDREGHRDDLVRALLARLKDQVLVRKAAEHKLALLQGLPDACHRCRPGATPPSADCLGDGEPESERFGRAELIRLERELARDQTNIADLHKQLFNERRDISQLRKEVSSLRLGLETANDMLDSNKVALGRSEAYGQVLKVSKDQLQERFEREQRDHEDCRTRLERLQNELQEARAKDPLIEAQIKTLGCHLHQRSGEVRALEDRLALREQETQDLRTQLDRQRDVSRWECESLQVELQQTQRQFAEALKKVNSNVPDPMPCDEEGLSALIQESNRLSPAVLDDLKSLLHNLKAELKSVERGVGLPMESTGRAVQHV